MRRLVVLRPEPSASITVDRARAMGLDAAAIPLFEIESLSWEAPDPSGFDALLLTSANGVRRGGEQLKKLSELPVHAVGHATAEAAREEGLRIASTGEGGVGHLLGSLPANVRLLHLCGQHRASAAGARQAITDIPVYVSRAVDRPQGLAGIAGAVVLVHSPRAASRFAQLSDAEELDRSSIALAAISPAAGEAAGSGWGSLDIAPQPRDDALLALAERLCHKR